MLGVMLLREGEREEEKRKKYGKERRKGME